MQENFDAPESPYIRVSRNGSVTQHRGDSEGSRAALDRQFSDDRVFTGDEGVSLRAARPMPKRLSEEVREAAEAERRRGDSEGSRVQSEQIEPDAKPKAARKTKAAKKQEAEQMALPLKPQREKPDSLVKQRQVLGFALIVAAILVMIALVSYSRDDASPSETKFGDLPSLFLPHGDAPDPVRDQVRANADQVKNSLGLTGAIIANFLINRTIGYAAILYPIFFGAWSLAFFRFTYKQRRRLTLATTFFLITAVLFSATMGTASNFANIPREWYGSVGAFLGLAFTRAIGGAGAFIIYVAAFIIMLVFSIDLDIERTFVRLKGWWTAAVMWSRRKTIEFWDKREAKQLAKAERRSSEEAIEAESREAETSLLDEPISEFNEQVEIASAEPQVIVKAAISTNAQAFKSRAQKPLDLATTADEIPPVLAKEIDKPVATSLRITETDINAPKPDLDVHATALPIPSAPIIAEASVAPLASSHVIAGQPLLKVRPAPKTNGTPIPRMTRSDRDRLGSRSVNFSRLTNGEIANEPESPVAPINTISALALLAPPAFGPTMEDVVQDVAEIEEPNIDLSEDIIDPFRSKAKSKSKRDTLPPIALGDEKVLSNEALPHSLANENPLLYTNGAGAGLLGRDQPPPNPRLEKAGGLAQDLFFEEGEKPVIPENPYLEMLTKYRNPPLDILTPDDPKDAIDANDEELAKKGRLLRDKLATFGVEIENITVTPGPVVTLYEFTPAEGVKVSRVENLTDDIALAMKARGIRIIAPIPGRGTIGVEIPNDVPKMVRIRSLLDSDSFRNTKMNLPLALGKTISGDVYIDDLNRMPHLLIAGATGSGKSVGVNGIIASLLYAKSPRDVKFVIIDPKKIELSLYKKLRKHYLIVSPEAGEDIVTTPAYAVLALKAVELEMERRYDKLAKAAVRSLADYNIKVAQGKLRSTQDEQHYHLPYIVVVIDELADLMITAAREIEEPICRIAQMARAVGIHLILATQRPSVDVITGVIKANFPARMAYQVATRVDSRTILDGMGAEQLLGNGDMLYQPSGTPKPIRLQSPFISTEEVEAIIDAIAEQEGDKLSYTRPWTLPSLRGKEDGGASYDDEGDGRDELFEEAARVIVRHQQGSVSLLQRRLKVGYSRAARIVDELEQAAIVGAFDGSKARQVLCESEAELEVVLEGLR